MAPVRARHTVLTTAIIYYRSKIIIEHNYVIKHEKNFAKGDTPIIRGNY